MAVIYIPSLGRPLMRRLPQGGTTLIRNPLGQWKGVK